MDEPTGSLDRDRATILAHLTFHCTKPVTETGEPNFKQWERFARDLLLAQSTYKRHHCHSMAGTIESLIDDAKKKAQSDEVEQTLEWLKTGRHLED